MRKPSRKTVIETLRQEVRFNEGVNRLVEAVELRSEIVVVEYEYVNKFPTDKGYACQRKLVVKPWWDRAPLSFIVERGCLEQYPRKES